MLELGRTGVQAEVKKAVAAYGGMVEHHGVLGRKGPPDLLVTWPGGVMHLVETKRPKREGGRLDASQLRDHARRRQFGVHVYVIWSKEAAWEYARYNGTSLNG